MSGFSSKNDAGIYADEVIGLVKERAYEKLRELMDKFGLPNPNDENQAIYESEALYPPFSAWYFIQELLMSVGEVLHKTDDDMFKLELLPRVARSVDLHKLARHLLALVSDGTTITEPGGSDFYESLSADGEPNRNTANFIRRWGLRSDALGLLRFFDEHPGIPVNSGYNDVILERVWRLGGVGDEKFFYVLACSLVEPAEVVELKCSMILLNSLATTARSPRNLATFLVSTKMAEDALRAIIEGDVGGGDEECPGDQHGICTGECGICKQNCPG